MKFKLIGCKQFRILIKFLASKIPYVLSVHGNLINQCHIFIRESHNINYQAVAIERKMIPWRLMAILTMISRNM